MSTGVLHEEEKEEAEDEFDKRTEEWKRRMKSIVPTIEYTQTRESDSNNDPEEEITETTEPKEREADLDVNSDENLQLIQEECLDLKDKTYIEGRSKEVKDKMYNTDSFHTTGFMDPSSISVEKAWRAIQESGENWRRETETNFSSCSDDDENPQLSYLKAMRDKLIYIKNMPSKPITVKENIPLSQLGNTRLAPVKTSPLQEDFLIPVEELKEEVVVKTVQKREATAGVVENRLQEMKVKSYNLCSSSNTIGLIKESPISRKIRKEHFAVRYFSGKGQLEEIAKEKNNFTLPSFKEDKDKKNG
jgi:hypothetical protein